MSIEVVRSSDVTIEFDGNRCIHSRNCVLNRPDVFVPNVVGEWIHPDKASQAEVLEIAHNCPSGAIRFLKPAEKQQVAIGVAKIDKKKCIRCFCCQEFCPKGAMKVQHTPLGRMLKLCRK